MYSFENESPKWLPGLEPEPLRRRLEDLFRQLDSRYSGKCIIWEQWDHKAWDSEAVSLCRELGYSRGAAFLTAYGYSILDGARFIPAAPSSPPSAEALEAHHSLPAKSSLPPPGDLSRSKPPSRRPPSRNLRLSELRPLSSPPPRNAPLSLHPPPPKFRPPEPRLLSLPPLRSESPSRTWVRIPLSSIPAPSPPSSPITTAVLSAGTSAATTISTSGTLPTMWSSGPA